MTLVDRFRGILFSLRRDKAGMTGFLIVFAVILIAIFAPLVSPYDPVEQDLSKTRLSPCKEHLFGTDEFGRDVLSRVLHGARVSLYVGVISVGIAFSIGTLLGLIGGYYGGIVDELIMRSTDILLALPYFLLAILVVAVLGVGLLNTMVAIGIQLTSKYVRVSRASVIPVKKQLYVRAARSIGANDRFIILYHILPNIVSPLTVLITLDFASAILTSAGLSFVGLGAQPPTPEWGAMLSSSLGFMLNSPHLMIFPGLAITITVLAFNLLGDALRDVLDPRLKKELKL